MGVRGLKTFIEKNDDLLIKEYRLHDTNLIIDACNLIGALMVKSQKHERADLFGGNMVQFGKYVEKFFNNLASCNIKPILVFDGAQTRQANKNKTREKQRRALERFQNVMSINKHGFGDFILPTTTTNVFKSVAVDKEIKIVQCMFEADAEVARLGNQLKCPIVSNDSDFFLVDLPYGLVLIDLLEHQDVLKTAEGSFYINCCLFMQDNFTSYFPNLDKKCLPLLGVLAGNDFVQGKVFDNICSQLPLQRLYENFGLRNAKQFRKTTTRQYEKIVKILYFLCDKSLNEIINQICAKVQKSNRAKLKSFIKSNLDVYKIPEEDDFERELNKLCRYGFYRTYSNSKLDENIIDRRFQETMRYILIWLRESMEKSVLSYRCLELAHRNILFLQSHMDDPQLPSAHMCQIRCFRVMLRLLRTFKEDSKPCIIYDRVTDKYGKFNLYPLEELENHGPLNYLIFDIPNLQTNNKINILLATFHSSIQSYADNIFRYYTWFTEDHAVEFFMIKLLLNYIEIEGDFKVWKQFRQATLICIIYHYVKKQSDTKLMLKLDEQFMNDLMNLFKKFKFEKTPQVGKRRLYNCRLMHQITQLQTAVVSYNFLNAFLGDVLNRLRSEYWLNSCLIYNLAESLRNKQFRLPINCPQIVFCD